MLDRRRDIIKHLMPQVPEKYQQTLDHAMRTWWVNLRRTGGMRLTDLGYEIMHDVLRLESWKLDLQDREEKIFTKRLILDLDRKLEWPYYIEVSIKKKRRHIVFFGSREAMMATMYGALNLWLDSIKLPLGRTL